jgi:hypothetical protein
MIFRKSLLGFFVASLLACSSAKSRDRTQDATQPETLKLRHQAAVGTVSFPELAADLGYLAPLELEFVGNFYDLASFFHRIKRFVDTTGDAVNVRGRLLTVEGMDFTSDPEAFPKITATLKVSAYLAPEAEGATAGATAGGPAVIPADGGDSAAPPVPTTPTATATR